MSTPSAKSYPKCLEHLYPSAKSYPKCLAHLYPSAKSTQPSKTQVHKAHPLTKPTQVPNAPQTNINPSAKCTPNKNQSKCQMHPRNQPTCQMHPKKINPSAKCTPNKNHSSAKCTPPPTTNPKLTQLSKYPHPNQRHPKDTPQSYTQSHTHPPKCIKHKVKILLRVGSRGLHPGASLREIWKGVSASLREISKGVRASLREISKGVRDFSIGRCQALGGSSPAHRF